MSSYSRLHFSTLLLLLCSFSVTTHGTNDESSPRTLLIDEAAKPQQGHQFDVGSLDFGEEWSFVFFIRPLSVGTTNQMRGVFESVCTVRIRDDGQLWVTIYSFKNAQTDGIATEEVWEDTLSFHAGILPVNAWTRVAISGSNSKLQVSVQFNQTSLWTYYMNQPSTPSITARSNFMFSRSNEDPANVEVRQLSYGLSMAPIAPDATETPHTTDGQVSIDSDSSDEIFAKPEGTDGDGGSDTKSWLTYGDIALTIALCISGALFCIAARRNKTKEQKIARTRAVLDNISSLEVNPVSPGSRVRSVVFAKDSDNPLNLP